MNQTPWATLSPSPAWLVTDITLLANPAYPTFAPWLKTHLAAPFQIQFFNELDVDVVNQEAKL